MGQRVRTSGGAIAKTLALAALFLGCLDVLILAFPRFTNFVASFGRVFFDEPNVTYLHSLFVTGPALYVEIVGVAPRARLFVLTIYGVRKSMVAEVDDRALGLHPGESYRIIVGPEDPHLADASYLRAPRGAYLALVRMYVPAADEPIPVPRIRYVRRSRL